MRSLWRLVRWLAALGVVAAVGVLAFWFLSAYQGFADQAFLEIERGTSTGQIAQELESQGVVRSKWAFYFVRALNPRARLQAGDYRFDSPATPWQVFEKIRRGEVYYEELTVPEGSNRFDIAALLEKMDTVDSKEFLKESGSPELIHDLDSQAPNLEGYLFPSTYRLTRATTAAQLCRLMTEQFRKVWSTLPNRPTDTHAVVTLASLVEKEAAIPTERPLIAAVFQNRLRKGMLLQCDPTTVYAALLENRYRGAIHKSDLASENPYNTYTHAGLPPGPIANPGAASLKAALQPATSEALYFVAKGDGSGTHVFSVELADHERAVASYRRLSGR